MNLVKKFGWNKQFQEELDKLDTKFSPARIISQHTNVYKVASKEGELFAEKSGKFDYFIESKDELPVIGDWVLIDIFKEENKSIIHQVLPRKNIFMRKKVGNFNTDQIIATNTDVVFIVSGLDDDYNLRRIERYITLVQYTKLKPVLIFNKTDLKRSIKKIQKEVDEIAPNLEKYYISCEKQKGFEDLDAYFSKKHTICFVGSSGVGKSSIINYLLEDDIIETNEVREKDSRGMHTTSTKQMYVLPQGAVLIDTPGLREVGLWATEESLNKSFDDINKLAEECKFRNCSHENEPDCAIQQALKDKILSEDRYKSYLKQKRELEYLQLREQKAKNWNSKKRWKTLTKVIRQYKKESHIKKDD